MNIKKYPVKVITAKGDTITLDQWQAIYGLPIQSNKFGKFFSLSESRFINDISSFGELVVN
jgi:hypothetical protein